jgi:hypothetical protein
VSPRRRRVIPPAAGRRDRGNTGSSPVIPARAEDDGRRGRVFTLRLSDTERGALEALANLDPRFSSYAYGRRRVRLGPFLVWSAFELAKLKGKKK